MNILKKKCIILQIIASLILRCQETKPNQQCMIYLCPCIYAYFYNVNEITRHANDFQKNCWIFCVDDMHVEVLVIDTGVDYPIHPFRLSYIFPKACFRIAFALPFLLYYFCCRSEECFLHFVA